MVGLISFYFSAGMLSLFIDASTNQMNTQKTFRNGFITFDDVWSVCCICFVYFESIEIDSFL